MLLKLGLALLKPGVFIKADGWPWRSRSFVERTA
jgi:hypothetical protein